MLGGGVTITWYGHGTWGHEEASGTRVLVDPWLSAPTTPEALRDPGRVDVVALTHGHVDHITDVEAVCSASSCPLVTKPELGAYFAERGVDVTAINTGGSVEVAGVRFTMTNAVHSGGITTGEGLVGYGGEPGGFVITFASGFRVYQAGDTAIFSDMRLIGELYRPDVAILPIGDYYTMGPFEAAHAVRLLGVAHVIGGHWGTFPVLTGTPEAFREELARIDHGHVTVHPLRPGDSVS